MGQCKEQQWKKVTRMPSSNLVVCKTYDEHLAKRPFVPILKSSGGWRNLFCLWLMKDHSLCVYSNGGGVVLPGTVEIC